MRWLVMSGFMLATVLGAPAQAADLGGDYRGGGSLKDEIPYAPPFTWTGVYVGAQIGYGWANTDARDDFIFDNFGYDGDGFIGGGHVGYNIQSGNVVYGVEADIEYTDLDYRGFNVVGDLHQTEINYMGSIRARLGYTMGRTLIYATGGYAYGDVDITNRSVGYSYSDTRHGYTVGAGVEQLVTNNLTARLEYRYTDLGEDSFRLGVADESTDVEVHAIRAGMSLKF